MARRTALKEHTNVTPLDPMNAPLPSGGPPQDRTGLIGDIVNYVMDDGVTIRPAIIVAYVTYRMHLESGGRRTYGFYDLQVFVDGAYDNDIRGAHADATLTDFKTNVPYDPGAHDDTHAGASPFYAPRTWHFRD